MIEAPRQKTPHKTYSFGDFTLDLTGGCLLREGTEVKLRPKSFEVLTYLVKNSGRLVSKEEVIGAVWRNTFVTDDSLVKCLKDVRLALEDESQQHVKTVPRRGYIFATEVRENSTVAQDSFSHEQIASFPVEIQRAKDDEGSTSPRLEIVELPRSVLRPGRLKNFPRAALVIVIAAFVLSSAALFTFRRLNNRLTDPSAPITSIAVLPLKNLSGDPTNDYFSDGMTESLISALSKVHGIKLISGSTVFQFKGRAVDLREVGRQLGVGAVLEGSVMKSGETVRVDVRLVSTADGRVLWSGEPQERALHDIFALQDEVARRVVAGLSVKLGREGEMLLAKRYTDNVEAYQAYMKGRYFWNKRNEEGFGKAISYFQQAIEIDPNYALAYAGLADTYILKRVYALLEPGETLPQMEVKARSAAEKALEIDETLAEAHTSLGLIKATTANDDADIEREYKRAIALNPNYATAHHWYALHLNDLARFDEAIAEINRAREIDPLSLVINSDVGIVFSSARRYDEAIAYFKKAMEMDPNFPDAHAMLGWTYVRKGMYPEGIAQFEKARTLFGSPTSQLDGLIYAYGMSGNRREALKLLDKLKKLSAQKHTQIPWENWVYIYVGVGEHDKAFELLEKAHHDGLSVKRLLDTPYLDPLRSDPRLADLRRRVDLPPSQ